MATVLGVGGLFFKSRDPEALGAWYQRWLGLQSEGQAVTFSPTGMPPAGKTVWAPFPAATDYFQPSSKEFMFNLVVDNLDEALTQVREGGAEIVGSVEESDYGRFGWFLDPEQNKVELWEPR
jgi:predicted enzyme related to lactoylglutathione lyase